MLEKLKTLYFGLRDRIIRDRTKWHRWYVRHSAIWILELVGYGYVAVYLNVSTRDSTGIISSVFAVIATLSALSFSYARAVDKNPALHSVIVSAGERLLHGAILFLTASLVKYGTIAFRRYLERTSFSIESGLGLFFVGSLSDILQVVLIPIVPVTFIIALKEAYAGIFVLNAVLWERPILPPYSNSDAVLPVRPNQNLDALTQQGEQIASSTSSGSSIQEIDCKPQSLSS